MRPCKITREIVEAYINCQTKAYPKLQGEHGQKMQYGIFC